MIRIITTFDSWHLDGVHCPSIRVGLPTTTLEEAINEYNRCNYGLFHHRDEKGNNITMDYLKECYEKDHTYIFATDDGKEGYIVINEDWTPTEED
jgi:hypothetical protein